MRSETVERVFGDDFEKHGDTAAVTVPTIGIGAGPECDDQVLVWHDRLGLFDGFRPKFVRRYADLGEQARRALEAYRDDVRGGAFPGPEHEFK